MKSLLITPKNQTGKTVTNTTLSISDKSDFSNILHTETLSGDRETILIEKAFLDKPLYVKVDKLLADGEHLEYMDKNPTVRGKELFIHEEGYNDNVNAKIEKTLNTNENTSFNITLDRVVDDMHVVATDVATNATVESVHGTDNTISISLHNKNFSKRDVLITINASLKQIPYRTVSEVVEVDTPLYIRGLKKNYFLDTKSLIIIEANNAPYTIEVDGDNLAIDDNNRYILNNHVKFGGEHKLIIIFSNGFVLEESFNTVMKTEGYDKDKIFDGVVDKSTMHIDNVIIPNAFYGDLVINSCFYLKEEDGKQKLFSYYIPSDNSMKMDADFQHGTIIEKVFKKSDSTLAMLTVSGATRNLVMFSYGLMPLSLKEEITILSLNVTPASISFLPLTSMFYLIEGNEFYKISGNIKSSITAPVSFTKGYVGSSGITEVLVILDKVLYLYDPITNDWDSIKTLPTTLIAKGIKEILSIAEGAIFVHDDNSMSKFEKKTSSIVSLDITLENCRSIFSSNHNLFFTKTNDTFVYTLS